MTIRPTETPRTADERRADTPIPVIRDLGAATREHKLKDGLHPSLRALPDYPAR